MDTIDELAPPARQKSRRSRIKLHRAKRHRRRFYAFIGPLWEPRARGKQSKPKGKDHHCEKELALASL